MHKGQGAFGWVSHICRVDQKGKRTQQDQRVSDISEDEETDRGVVWRGKGIYGHEAGEVSNIEICKGAGIDDGKAHIEEPVEPFVNLEPLLRRDCNVNGKILFKYGVFQQPVKT
jgi:hypothetical protein